jgi:hypothetical protein
MLVSELKVGEVLKVRDCRRSSLEARGADIALATLTGNDQAPHG